MKYSELNVLYLSLFLLTFSISLIGVFIPIFFLEKGITLPTIYSFYLIFFTVLTVLSLPIVRLIPKIGVKHLMLIRFPIELLFLFYLMKFDPNLLFPVAILWGIGFTSFWNAFNSHFFHSSHKHQRYTEASLIGVLPNTAAALAPIIGALIITNLGYPPLLIFSFIITALAAYPLIFTPENRLRFNFTPHWNALKTNVFFLFQGFTHIIEWIFWPVWVYLNGGILNAGIAASLAILGLALFQIFVGKFSDKFGWRYPITLGMLSYMLVWVFRTITVDPNLMFLLSFAGGLSTALIGTPAFGLLNHLTPRKSFSVYVAIREVALGIGRMFCLGLLLLLPFNYPFFFILMAIASVIMTIYTLLF
jgi:MFS family permease